MTSEQPAPFGRKHHGTRSSWAWIKLRNRRREIGRDNDEPCAMCGHPIDYTQNGNHPMGPTVDHQHMLVAGGDLLPPIESLRMAHRRCSNAQGAAVARAMAKGRKKGNVRQIRPSSPGDVGQQIFGAPAPPTSPQEAEPLPDKGTLTLGPLGSPLIPGGGGREWAEVPWISDLLPVPEGSQWPTHMTGMHPRAVGSYGLAAEEWLNANVTEVGRPLVLRWWQRLALRRQLEHDAQGALVWPQVVESTPRRSGKSVRLRAVALWRLHHAHLIGEEQLILLTGKDLPIVREIIRKAWPWAITQGYPVRKANGQEEVEAPDGSRWIVRGKESVYGYDVGLGLVDECHGVDAGVVDDGLEPALLERRWPQLVLTSTAHRKATALMRSRLAAARAQVEDPRDVLLLLWCAPDGADVTDREAWRLASPHWTPERERMISGVLDRVLSGAADPDPDEPDPVEAMRSQYLNIWPRATRRSTDWLPADLVDRAGNASGLVLGESRVAAIESSVDGSQWSAAVSDGEHARVAVGFSRLPEALAWVTEQGVAEIVAHAAVEARLWPEREALIPVHAITTGEDCAATASLADAVRHGAISWDCPTPGDLVAQFGHVVTQATPGGPRISPRLSRGSVEAVTALARAHWRAVHDAPEPARIW